MKKDLSNVKKSRRGRYLLPAILILLIILASAFILIGHRPGNYAPPKAANPNEVSRYLTNELLPTIYNGAQLGESFELEITQEGLNDIISHLPGAMITNDLTLVRPEVILTPMQITVMATAEAMPMDLFLTVELNPFINKEGLMNLCVNRILLGKVNITSIARSIGNKAYADWMATTGTEPNNIASQICLSLLKDEPFDPVVKMNGRTLRVSKIDVMRRKIVVLLTVVHEPSKRSSKPPQGGG
ncbi:MAG: hypothetical protein ABSB91_07730 [Sedimentisphaerales bacterium]